MFNCYTVCQSARSSDLTVRVTGQAQITVTGMILFYSNLFYPITFEGCQGTTGEFTTIAFHLVLFSAALVELAKSISVHSLILSFHLFFYLPLFLCPFSVPCRIVSSPEHEVLMVSYCHQSMSVVRRQQFVLKANSS